MHLFNLDIKSLSSRKQTLLCWIKILLSSCADGASVCKSALSGKGLEGDVITEIWNC